MPRLLFVFVAVCAMAVIASAVGPEYAAYKSKFGKQHKNASEDSKREANFLARMTKIKAHNARFKAGKVGYANAPNEMSDWHDSERNRLKGTMETPRTKRSAFEEKELARLKRQANPASVDWTSNMNPVLQQGSCMSCWAFSAAGVMEAVNAITGSGSPDRLSEQQLMDCVTPNWPSCDVGGYISYAIDYAVKNEGLASNADYPYADPPAKGTCKTSVTSAKNSSGTKRVNIFNDEGAIKSAVANHPVSGSLNVDKDDFMDYSGFAIYDNANCATNTNHAVIIVGYGTDDNGVDYWIIKNSWGTSWGQNGYGRVQRGVNRCGIASQSFYPSV